MSRSQPPSWSGALWHGAAAMNAFLSDDHSDIDRTLAKVRSPVERRRAPRYDCDWPVVIRRAGDDLQGETLVVSLSGLLFTSSSRIAIGEEVYLTAHPHRTLALAL